MTSCIPKHNPSFIEDFKLLLERHEATIIADYLYHDVVLFVRFKDSGKDDIPLETWCDIESLS